ncbi:NAD(P)H-hydrate dehydratase [Candidatus Omnitrophota bacterium]
MAGSVGLTGAAALTCSAALRSGAGLVTLGIPRSLNDIMEAKLTEVMTLPLPETTGRTLSIKARSKIESFCKRRIDCVVIGPGLSTHAETQRLVRALATKLVQPMIIDADGLNAFAGNLQGFKKRSTLVPILSPHPGEMARLLDTSAETVQKNRKKIAISVAKKYNSIIVLKGNQTIVASPKNTGYVNSTGNAGMATAGSGDVLTGVIAAFVAQGLDNFVASQCATYIHGLAGDIAAKEKTQLGLIASDIIEAIPFAIKRSLKK